MGTMASQITASRLFAQPFIQAQINDNIVTREMFPFDDVIMYVHYCIDDD